MRALVCYERAPGCMELREMPDPAPASDEVLVEVAFAGICGSDVKLFHGEHPHATPPIVPGHEFSGVVAAVGSAVKSLEPGDRVTGTGKQFPPWAVVGDSENPNAVPGRRSKGLHLDGAFARYITLNERLAFKLPDQVSLQAAAVTEPLCVAMHAVLARARLLPIHRALVSGPGPIGLLVTQLVRLQGAGVLVSGLTRDVERLALARSLGATETVDVEKEDLPAAVARFTGGKGVDVAFECVGAASSVESCLAALRWYGQHVQVGTFGFNKRVELLLNHMIYKELTITGVYGHPRNEWLEAVQLLSEGKVKTEPLVSHVYPLEGWREAFETAEKKAGVKVLLRP